LIRDKKL